MWCVAKGKLFPEKTQETTQIRFLSGNLLADCADVLTLPAVVNLLMGVRQCFGTFFQSIPKFRKFELKRFRNAG